MIGLRYLAVGGTCALVNVAVLVAAEAAGLQLWGGIALSFGLVCTVGYALHAKVTFAAPLAWGGFARYVAAMAAGLPMSAALLWLFARALGWPMPVAASCAMIATLALNFVSSRWAVLRRHAPFPQETRHDGYRDAPAPQIITPQAVAATLGRHFGLYRHRAPHYQAVMLSALRALWQGHHARVLDIGGGTGVIAQCLAELFPVDAVTSVDVEDRFCAGLSVATRVYDGTRLPFGDGTQDAATINNVVHHIPPAIRVALFRDVARVVDGPLYIKDHVSRGRIDDLCLTALDMIGNIAFAGQVRADYLTLADWQALAEASGYRIAATRTGIYRRGPMAWTFPNRLEIAMRWEPR